MRKRTKKALQICNNNKLSALRFLLCKDTPFLPGCWKEVSQLIEKEDFTLDELKELVQNDAKKQFEFSKNMQLIRARFGHCSSNYYVCDPVSSVPEQLFYPETVQNVDVVSWDGIGKSNQGGRMIKLFASRYDIWKRIKENRFSDKRWYQRGYCQTIIFTVDAAAMSRDGIMFYTNEKGEYFVETIPFNYLTLSLKDRMLVELSRLYQDICREDDDTISIRNDIGEYIRFKDNNECVISARIAPFQNVEQNHLIMQACSNCLDKAFPFWYPESYWEDFYSDSRKFPILKKDTMFYYNTLYVLMEPVFPTRYHLDPSTSFIVNEKEKSVFSERAIVLPDCESEAFGILIKGITEIKLFRNMVLPEIAEDYLMQTERERLTGFQVRFYTQLFDFVSRSSSSIPITSYDVDDLPGFQRYTEKSRIEAPLQCDSVGELVSSLDSLIPHSGADETVLVLLPDSLCDNVVSLTSFVSRNPDRISRYSINRQDKKNNRKALIFVMYS